MENRETINRLNRMLPQPNLVLPTELSETNTKHNFFKCRVRLTIPAIRTMQSRKQPKYKKNCGTLYGDTERISRESARQKDFEEQVPVYFTYKNGVSPRGILSARNDLIQSSGSLSNESRKHVSWSNNNTYIENGLNFDDSNSDDDETDNDDDDYEDDSSLEMIPKKRKKLEKRKVKTVKYIDNDEDSRSTQKIEVIPKKRIKLDKERKTIRESIDSIETPVSSKDAGNLCTTKQKNIQKNEKKTILKFKFGFQNSPKRKLKTSPISKTLKEEYLREKYGQKYFKSHIKLNVIKNIEEFLSPPAVTAIIPPINTPNINNIHLQNESTDQDISFETNNIDANEKSNLNGLIISSPNYNTLTQMQIKKDDNNIERQELDFPITQTNDLSEILLSDTVNIVENALDIPIDATSVVDETMEYLKFNEVCNQEFLL